MGDIKRRDSLVFYRSFYESVAELSDDDRLKVYDALFEYALDGKEPSLSGAPLAIFKLMRPQVDANNRKYENGKKGGRPAKHSKEDTAESKKARQSVAYKKWQKAVFDRDGHECQMCGSKDDLQAHHKLDLVEFPDLRYELQNGITLCRTCHNKVHKKPSENQEQTKSKPRVNQEQTKSKPNVNVNVNDNVNVNVNGRLADWIADIVPAELRDVFHEWADMRKAQKKAIPSRASVQRAYNQLTRLSKNVSVQRQIVEQSIDHCWASFYELKDKPRKTYQEFPKEKPVQAVPMTEEQKKNRDKIVQELKGIF